MSAKFNFGDVVIREDGREWRIIKSLPSDTYDYMYDLICDELNTISYYLPEEWLTKHILAIERMK